jgi:ER lumen protein retaining receptor
MTERKPASSRLKHAEVLCGGALVLALVVAALRLLPRERDAFNLASEVSHAIAAAHLLHRLARSRKCSGVSLKAQELVSLYLLCRSVCSLRLEMNEHTLLDALALAFSISTVFLLRFQKRTPGLKDEAHFDRMNQALIIGPCAFVAGLVHPPAPYSRLIRILWAFSLNLEALSILPQLYMLRTRGDKPVEPFLASYLMLLGISRFFTLFHWIFQFIDNSLAFTQLVHGNSWIYSVLTTEIVSTLMLSDFTYLYFRKLYFGQQPTFKLSEFENLL